MRYIEIAGDKQPFKLTFRKISQFCNSKDYSFSDIGEMLQKDPIESLYGLIVLGLNEGANRDNTKEVWTEDRIDEIVGTDAQELERLGEILTESLGVEKNEEGLEE